MSDDEDYNSEEDLDYVPSEGEQVSEEEHSGEEEDLSLLQDGEGDVKTGTGKRKSVGKKKKSVLTARKRKGGIKLDENQGIENGGKEESNEEETKRKKELAEQIAKEEEERKQEKDKKRADDLWASFMSDVKKPSVPIPRPSNQSSLGSGLASLCSTQVKSPSVHKKVTITKVFDFAGEEIKVTKEVDADSKEAKEERKKKEQVEESKDESVNSSTSSTESGTTLQSSLKRPGSGGLGSVLSKIGKKSKMGTLEKSKIDWESFKSKEGIQEDLKIHNKGKQGYTDRMAFLNRTDQKQYEIERDLRLGANSKR